MSIVQTLKQLENLADNLTWADTSKRVFAKDAVLYSALPWSQLIQIPDLRYPWCIFNLISASNHPEIHGLMDVTFRASIGVKQENDRLGKAIISGGRQAFTTGDSDAKGVLQLKTKLSEELRLLTRDNGIIFGVRETSLAVGGLDVGQSQIAVLETDYEAIVFEDEFFPDVYNLTGSQSGSDAVLVWSADPPARYDRLNIVIRRGTNSGDAAPTSVTGGVAVGAGTVALGVKTITDTAPGNGTWNYTVFGAYDESRATPATAESYSSGKSVQVVVS